MAGGRPSKRPRRPEGGSDSKKGVLPKYDAKIAKLASKAPGLPPCTDFAGDGAVVFDCVPEEPTPTEGDFDCTLDASDLLGNQMPGTCSVSVVTAP